MSKFGAQQSQQIERDKASEAILAGKADSAIAAVLSAARAAGWLYSNRPTKGND